MTIEVHATEVAVFANGRRVLAVNRPGTMMVAGLEGPETVEKAFQVGDVVLADRDNRVMVHPLSFARATEIATSVIEGDLRVATDSQALRALATAVIGFAAQAVAPEPVRAAIEPEREIVLTQEETAYFEREGHLRGATARFAAADRVVDANGRILKDKGGV